MTPTIINRHPHKIFKSEAEAAAIAAQLAADDADWTYTVKVDPNGSGKAIIEVIDENGEIVDLL